MIRVGITGGIGTGKSTVAKVFSSLGIPFLDADRLAKEIVENDESLRKKIVDEFGSDSYTSTGKYNRTFIANIVFNDKAKLQTLNSIVHPAVIDYSNRWALEHQGNAYVLKEAALMFESGSYKYNDVNILVMAPLELRIQRLKLRDHATEEEILKRINAQMSDEEKKKFSDKIIINDEHHSIIEQVMQLHQEFLNA